MLTLCLGNKRTFPYLLNISKDSGVTLDSNILLYKPHATDVSSVMSSVSHTYTHTCQTSQPTNSRQGEVEHRVHNKHSHTNWYDEVSE